MNSTWLSFDLADEGEMVLVAIRNDPQPVVGIAHTKPRPCVTTDDGGVIEPRDIAGVLLIPPHPYAERFE